MPAGRVRDAGRGEAKAWVAQSKTFELGGETSENNRLRVGDIDSNEFGMLLGIDFFLLPRPNVSNARRRL